MEFDGKRISYAQEIWVQHGGVTVLEKAGRITVEGLDDESYFKVFNHFGRVLKLFTFENGHWIDTETGLEAKGLDDSHAGRIPGVISTAEPPAARKKRPPSRGKASTSGAKKSKSRAKATVAGKRASSAAKAAAAGKRASSAAKAGNAAPSKSASGRGKSTRSNSRRSPGQAG